MITQEHQEDFLKILDDLSKSRKEKKKEEYLKKLKEKKAMKKQTKKLEKKAEKINGAEENLEDEENNNLEVQNNQTSNRYLNNRKDETDDLQKILKEENIEIEYVEEDPTIKAKSFENFKNVFDYFVIPKKEKREYNDDDEEDIPNDIDGEEIDGEGYDETNYAKFDNPEANGNLKLSKKKRKQMSRMKISELKQFTDYPEIVEGWDITAKDPIFLIRLKSMKNTVPVPNHWAQKRKFLQNKRGVLKPPFKLPDFIEATGISKIRDNTGADKKSLKQKMRERMQPKLGRMDIDYQVLHDAFFKYHIKPNLTIHGDVYYENKEFETKMRMYKPGRISEKLRVALGIAENSPPPWIINMQRYGPPPSYPNLKIPGVNAPLCDPTAEITPNLWTPPPQEEKRVLVYDFSAKMDQNHWGDFREIDEDEESEEYNDDASISEEGERPAIDNLFKEGDLNFTEGDKYGLGNTKPFNMAISQFSQQDVNVNVNLLNAVPNPNANIIYPNYNQKGVFTTLEQKVTNIKQSEIVGSSYSYALPTHKMDESFLSIDDDNDKKDVKVNPPLKEENKEFKAPTSTEEKNKEVVKQRKAKSDKYNNFKF
jgi:splicing factor 3B subunit 2